MNCFIKYLPLFLALVIPDFAFAGGIDEFSGPLEKLVATLTGNVGKAVSIAGIGSCGIYFAVNRESIDGIFKVVIGVVMGICLIPFAGDIINSMFSFSGAVI